MYGTYCRLRISIWASDFEVIRAARKKIVKKFRTDRAKRDARHKFYEAMLGYHHEARQLALRSRL